MNCCPSPAHSESHKAAPSSGWKWLVGGARTGFLSSFTPFVRKAQTKLRGGPGSAVPVFTWGLAPGVLDKQPQGSLPAARALPSPQALAVLQMKQAVKTKALGRNRAVKAQL